MSQLEKLTLSLYAHGRTSFIDGTHLNNDIIRKMPYLHTFIFDIVTEDIIITFPLLEDLTVLNTVNQKKRSNKLDEHEQTFSIIEYSHLMTLDLIMSHGDYVKQFLFNTNTRLPRLSTLSIDYENLNHVIKIPMKTISRIPQIEPTIGPTKFGVDRQSSP
ncbi:unnamed protein product [Rotaria sp. Silwood1]|nr:unnamed protein product [Rotaria sp. Silwood1]